MTATPQQFDFTGLTLASVTPKPKAFPMVFNFIASGVAGALDTYNLDFKLPFDQGKLDNVQSVFVDNSANPFQTLFITVPKTNQIIEIPPTTRAFYSLLLPPQSAQMTVSCPGGNSAKLTLLNIPCPLVMPDTVESVGNLTGDKGLILPAWIGTIRLVGTKTTTGLTNILSIASGFGMVITDFNLSISGDASLSAAGEFNVTFGYADGQNKFSNTIFLPGAPATNFGAQNILSASGIAYYSKLVNVSLQLTFSAALASGIMTFNIGYAQTPFLHP